jgi:ABC-type Fe3+ transport system permease subunit
MIEVAVYVLVILAVLVVLRTILDRSGKKREQDKRRFQHIQFKED